MISSHNHLAGYFFITNDVFRFTFSKHDFVNYSLITVLIMVSYISISLLGYGSSSNYGIHHQMVSSKGYHHQ